jgi:predicted ferric reductase
VTAPALGPTYRAESLGPRRVDLSVVLVALGAGAVAGLGWVTEASGFTHAPGGIAMFLGRLAGLLGTYFALLSVALAARIRFIERRLGHDRLLYAHRRLGALTLYLVLAHVVLISYGYAESDHVGIPRELWDLVTGYPDLVRASVAWLLFMTIGVLAIPQVRHRLRYVTWWLLHLATYLAVVLAYGHEVTNGAAFVHHPLLEHCWLALHWAVGLAVLWGRVLQPTLNSLYHGLRVHAVVEEAPGIISVHLVGHHLQDLEAHGGQYFLWRFLVPGLWWRAHPYSLSSVPNSRYVRLTAREVGPHSQALRHLKPGARVAVEGPYGRFHSAEHGELQGQRLLLIAGGVGVAPVRAILEEAGRGAQAVVLYRVRDMDEALWRKEFESLAQAYGARVLLLAGNRRQQPLDAKRLLSLVPDIRRRTIFVCGPEALVDTVRREADRLGVPPERVHAESFAFLPTGGGDRA